MNIYWAFYNISHVLRIWYISKLIGLLALQKTFQNLKKNQLKIHPKTDEIAQGVTYPLKHRHAKDYENPPVLSFKNVTIPSALRSPSYLSPNKTKNSNVNQCFLSLHLLLERAYTICSNKKSDGIEWHNCHCQSWAGNHKFLKNGTPVTLPNYCVQFSIDLILRNS